MKKVLPVAVLAAMAGVNSAQAVHVNPDGLGQVLLFPYYTAQAGQDTYIQIVNTTDQFKAVKVRYLESRNSREVLDFNLYLSPKDHWSALVTADPSGAGALQTTSDTSCIVPNFVSSEPVPFRNFEYTSDSVSGLERTLEGYVEVIEMGEVVVGSENWPAAIKHVNGVPGDCSVLNSAWNAGGVWSERGLDQPTDGIEPPTGGLYGYGVIINVDEGTDATYDALALDNFNNLVIHTEPGSLDPGLDDGVPFYDVIEGNQVISGIATATGGVSAGLNAVSALLMHDTINNDYVLEPSIDAGTDWVVTFPTKRDYVNGGLEAPFTTAWDRNVSRACESFDAVYYDREEGQEAIDDLDVSPRPPEGDPISLCYEANILTFDNSNVLDSAISTNFDLAAGFDNGWMSINFASGRAPLVAGDNTFQGLPVIGFAVQKYVNGDVGGLLSNYVGNVSHKATRSVSSAP